MKIKNNTNDVINIYIYSSNETLPYITIKNHNLREKNSRII